jgi:hypothetical protein
MKNILIIFLTFAAIAAYGQNPFQKINVGTSPNDHTGDPLRDAFIKVNDNYDVAADSFSIFRQELAICADSNQNQALRLDALEAASPSVTSTGTIKAGELSIWSNTGSQLTSAPNNLFVTDNGTDFYLNLIDKDVGNSIGVRFSTDSSHFMFIGTQPDDADQLQIIAPATGNILFQAGSRYMYLDATGLRYATDYSSGATDRWIPDKAYVDAHGGGGVDDSAHVSISTNEIFEYTSTHGVDIDGQIHVQDGHIEFVNISEPATPSANKGRLFMVNDSLYFKNESGALINIMLGGSAAGDSIYYLWQEVFTYMVQGDSVFHMLIDTLYYTYGWGDATDSTGMKVGSDCGIQDIVQDSLVCDSLRYRILGTGADMGFTMYYGEWGTAGTALTAELDIATTDGWLYTTTFTAEALAPGQSAWIEFTDKTAAGTAFRAIFYYHEKRAL